MTRMASQINFDSVGAQPLSRVYFTPEAKAFSLHAGVNGEYLCRIAYSLQCFANDRIEDGLVELFTHPTHAESDVRPVKLASADQTVGWLCTIGALTSDQHEYSESPHFRRAAFMATHILINSGRYTKEPKVNHDAEMRMSDFFDEELSVLILHKPSIGSNVGSACAEILPSLHQHGFVPLGTQQSPPMEVGKVATEMFANSGKKIRLFPMSRDVEFEDFTNQVFRQLLPSAPTPLLRFFIYYQLIETLLARIFNDRQSETIMMMVPVRGIPAKVHPLIEKLKKDATETMRMKLLFNEYSGTDTKMGDLLTVCNDFLTQSGAAKKVAVSEALYAVRNSIFHDLRGIPEKAMPLLKVIVEQMGYAVPELLVSFRIPAAK